MKIHRLIVQSLALAISVSPLQAQLIDVHFNNNSYGTGAGPTVGPDMSGAAVLGAAGDQWNNIDVNSGTGIPLIYANGSNSPVTVTFASQGGYDANSFGGSTPFAGTAYDALMEDYLFTKDAQQTITLSGLAPNSYYNLVLYNAGDSASAGRTTVFTVNGFSVNSTWDASSSTLIAGTDYVEFPAAVSDGSGNLVVTWAGYGGAEGDINGFQIQPFSQVPPLRVTHVAAGDYFAFFILSDGSLWGMGANGIGQLGLGQVPMLYRFPQEIVTNGVTAVSGGADSTLFTKSDGSLWGMGDNFFGELGDGTYVTRYFPEKIVSSDVTVFAEGSVHSLFATFHFPAGPGTLWGMGGNALGELGKGGYSQTNIPQAIVSNIAGEGAAATAVATGTSHSLFIQPGGGLWAMGYNASGQLGDGTTNISFFPEEIVASNVVAIACGANNSLFIKSDGSLWGMGDNSLGQLGDGTTNNQLLPEQIVASNVIAIAAGGDHSLFIKSDGSLWGMGDNSIGELGVTLAISGANLPVQIVPGNVVAIAADLSGSLFIKSDGSLWGMGNNGYGAQLGDARYTNNAYVPVEIVPLAPLANGGFETGDFSGWATSGNAAYTYVATNSLYTKSLYIHSGACGAQLGPVGSLGYLSQTLLTTPGTTYVLSFWLNSSDGETPNEFQVSWNGATIFDQTDFSTPGWTNIVMPVTATGANTVLQFGVRNDAAFFGLDDISLVALKQPILNGISLAGTNVALDATNGQTGGTYFSLTSTNLLLPLSQWTPVGTNVLSVSGSFTNNITNGVTPGVAQRFYILKMQD